MFVLFPVASVGPSTQWVLRELFFLIKEGSYYKPSETDIIIVLYKYGNQRSERGSDLPEATQRKKDQLGLEPTHGSGFY